MKTRHFGLLLALALALGCSTTRPPDTTPEASVVTARTLSDGYFDCFEKGLKDEDGRKVSCEISAVAFAGGQVEVGNDKSVPGGSPVMSIDWNGPEITSIPEPIVSDVMLGVRKIEGATTTPDGEWVLVTTAFDRVRDDSAKWNPYNSLLYWPSGKPEQARISHPSTVDGFASSIELRAHIQEALADEQYPDGPPYFKIEALAAIPGERLLFGVREVGDDYETFRYAARILSVGYGLEDGELRLDADFRMVYDGERARSMEGLSGPLGLSSLEYDRYHDRLFVLTTYEVGEDDEDLGAYLWVLPMQDFEAGKMPSLVMGRDGSPYTFAHKAEGLAVIDAETLLFVHDDDRVFGDENIKDPKHEFHREHSQSAWTVVRID